MTTMMKDDLKDSLFSAEEIDKRVKELGAQITLDYTGKSLLLIGILKGCFIFLADIARCINLDCEVRFLTASSYGFRSAPSGEVKIDRKIDFEVRGRDILIVEDILDSGVTMTTLRTYIIECSPASVRVCTLLDKPARRKVPVQADYVGFLCPDEFVVGYGLDYAERYRNLPYVASLKPEIYS